MKKKRTKGIISDIKNHYNSSSNIYQPISTGITLEDFTTMLETISAKTKKNIIWIGLGLAKHIAENPEYGPNTLLGGYELGTIIPIDEATKDYIESLKTKIT